MIQIANDFKQVMKAARRVSTPLIAVRTFDPASAIEVALTVLHTERDAPQLFIGILCAGSAL